MRWLGILRAEFVREFKTAMRYPLEVLTGIVIMYTFFLGIRTGAAAMSGGALAGMGMETVTTGYCMWFLAIMAINSMSVDLESEARQGTLEQLFLHAPNLTALIWVRGVVHLLMGSGAVLILLLAIQFTTGHWLPFHPGLLLPILATLILTTTALLGCGLAFGGLALVYKRIGQLAAILQFGLFLLAFTDLSKLAYPWNLIAAHAPFVSGIAVIKALFASGSHIPWAQIGLLALDAVVYAALGTLLFVWLKRTALRGGLLSHY